MQTAPLGASVYHALKGTVSRIGLKSWVPSYPRHESSVSWRTLMQWWSYWGLKVWPAPCLLGLLFSTFHHSDFSQINNEVIAVRQVHSPSVTFALWRIKHNAMCAPEMRQHDVCSVATCKKPRFGDMPQGGRWHSRQRWTLTFGKDNTGQLQMASPAWAR